MRRKHRFGDIEQIVCKRGLRLIAAEKGVVIAAGIWGKAKTMTQMIAVIMLLEHPPLMEKLRASKMLPIRELSLASGVSRKVIERHRKYIIACAEILSGDFPILGTYLSYVRELARQDG